MTNSVDDTSGVWHSRGYLPHFERPGLIQMITYCLADAARARVARLATAATGIAGVSPARFSRLEDALDAGHGSCYLRDKRVARLVETAFLHDDSTRYHLLAWVVMPNHVHVLIETVAGCPLSAIVHSWKSYTAKAANQLLVRSGVFWNPDYFDRAIRDERHLASAVVYIHNNPVKAGLVRRPEDWMFSSARRGNKRAGETPALPGHPFLSRRTVSPKR